MQIANTNTVAKIAAVVAGLGLVAMSFASFAPAAKADATTDLQSQITALLSQIAALQAQIGGGTAATASYTFTTDLTVGSTGAAVTALQNFLISKGYTIPAGATGFFGAQTKAALAAFQSAKGISPAVGYFGPLTRASVNSMMTTTTTTTTSVPGCSAGAAFSSTTGQACGTTTTTTTSTGPLTGTGRLTGISSLGDVNSDLKEGDSATQVIGVSVDATDGDVAIQRLDTTFLVASAGSQSGNLNKYVSDVSVYLNGVKLGSMSASDGDKDSTNSHLWTLRFTGLNGVVKKGTTGNLYVKVTPLSSIGTNETGQTVTAELLSDSLRAVGSDGISETYISGTISQAFTVSSLTSGTLTVSAGSDNPTASQVAVASSTTSGVTLVTFNLKAKNQDVDVNSIVASFNTSDSLTDVISTVKLMKGSTVLKSKTVTGTTYGTVTFDNLNQTISKDDTVGYSIVADIKGDSAYPDGTTLIASTTVAGWDVSDADGASVTPSTAVAGNTQTLTATGISVALGTVAATNNNASAAGGGAHDTATFTIPFTVTAGDNDVFIAGTAAKTGATTALVYATTTQSVGNVLAASTGNVTAANTVTGDTATAYKVLAGTSRTFTLNVVGTQATASGLVAVQISSIAYGLTNALGSTFSSNLDTFKTGYTNMVF